MPTSTDPGAPGGVLQPDVWQDLDGWRIEGPHGTVRIARFGGQLLSWVPADGIERLWVSPAPRAALPAGTAVRGGVPICWPWFARQHRADSDPMHGVVRTATWDAGTTRTAADGTVGVPLAPQPLTDAQRQRLGALAALSVSLEIEVGPALVMRLVTRHGGSAGSAPLRLTQAFHTYFAVDDLAVASVTGLAGTRYLDKRDGFAQKDQHGEPRLTEPVDRIHEGTAGRYALRGGPRHGVAIDSPGSRTAILWNPGADDARGFADVPGDSWRRFVCLEVAHASGGTLDLAAGDTATLTQVLTPLGAA